MLGDAILDLYHLRGEGDQLNDEPIDQSEALPGIDLALLRRCIVLACYQSRKIRSTETDAPDTPQLRELGGYLSMSF